MVLDPVKMTAIFPVTSSHLRAQGREEVTTESRSLDLLVVMFPSLSTCVCPTSELFPHVLSSVHLLHKSSWFRTLQAPQCSSGCLCPSYFPQQDRWLPELCSPHIANLEDAFIGDYPITSKKDGRRERPLTGMVSRLLTEGSMLLYQQKGERFEVLHLKITLGCFTKAWSKKGRRQI